MLTSRVAHASIQNNSGVFQGPAVRAFLFDKNRVHRHAQRFFPKGGVTVRGNDSLTLRCHFVHLVHCRGTRQMPTSGQMLFTMAVFGHVLIAGITLLIAVALDDSM